MRNGDYAFIGDRTPFVVKALSDPTCNLVVMEDMFLPKPFGLGLQEGSPYQGIFVEG